MDKYAGARYEEIGAMLHDETVMTPVVKKYFLDRTEDKVTALDLGIGTGHTTAAVLEADPRIRVVCVDNSEERLVIAKDRLDGKVKLVNADILDYLKLQEAESFDLVYSGFTLHCMPKWERKVAYHGIQKVLKSDGMFLDYDVSIDRERGLDKLIGIMKIFSGAVKEGGVSKDEFITWMDHLIEERSEGIRMYTDERLEALVKAGFTNKVEYVDPRIDSVLVSSRKVDVLNWL